MPDITMCDGNICPLKDRCYRATATPNPYRQSYFMKPPYKNGSCEYFSPDDRHEAEIAEEFETSTSGV